MDIAVVRANTNSKLGLTLRRDEGHAVAVLGGDVGGGAPAHFKWPLLTTGTNSKLHFTNSNSSSTTTTTTTTTTTCASSSNSSAHSTAGLEFRIMELNARTTMSHIALAAKRRVPSARHFGVVRVAEVAEIAARCEVVFLTDPAAEGATFCALLECEPIA